MIKVVIKRNLRLDTADLRKDNYKFDDKLPKKHIGDYRGYKIYEVAFKGGINETWWRKRNVWRMKFIDWFYGESHNNKFALIGAILLYFITYPYFYITEE